MEYKRKAKLVEVLYNEMGGMALCKQLP